MMAWPKGTLEEEIKMAARTAPELLPRPSRKKNASAVVICIPRRKGRKAEKRERKENARKESNQQLRLNSHNAHDIYISSNIH